MVQLPDKMRLDLAIDVNYDIVSKVALFQVPPQVPSRPPGDQGQSPSLLLTDSFPLVRAGL